MSANEYHIDINEELSRQQPAALLASQCGLSKQKAKEAMQKGAVWLTHGKHTRRLRRQKSQLKAGDSLHFYYNPEVLKATAQTAVLIADEQSFSLWNKPSGMLSQGSKWGDHTTITRWAEKNLEPQRPAFLVHRLDRAARGLILIAHSKKAAQNLSALFAHRAIEKHYKVIVHGEFPDQEEIHFDNPIDDKASHSIATREAFDAHQNRSLLDVRIESGRKHQIRRHLSEAGFPVVGDRLYGHEGDSEDLQLASASLEFINPFSTKHEKFMLESPLSL